MHYSEVVWGGGSGTVLPQQGEVLHYWHCLELLAPGK